MRRGNLRALVVVSALVVAIASGRARAGDADAPGMRAYVDPRTGQLMDHPPPGEPAPAATPAQSRSGVGLVETRAAGGGMEVDLQGRFQSPLVATVGSDGTLHMHHADGAE
ncbi:MAG TPA: hypothetical protein VMS22_17425 [Candidatus Eisenbacteria bacterium]|nr:hypothetical protein [Candidatus Eisenbacteria bacterium]